MKVRSPSDGVSEKVSACAAGADSERVAGASVAGSALVAPDFSTASSCLGSMGFAAALAAGVEVTSREVVAGSLCLLAGGAIRRAGNREEQRGGSEQDRD